MAYTKRQGQIPSPEQIPKDVFSIGDVSLSIPPQSIEIRKENLTYRFKTLRTKSSTKLPTGSGQISIHLSIPFTNDRLLSLHRLLIEIRNSPFVWVDNRYVRESIVPDWPYTQQMAFTITGLSVANMPNTTDCWMLELDATWFNYMPFGHNFLFREDWQTNWLRTDSNESKTLQSFTIGWMLDSMGNRQYYSNPVDTIESDDSNSGSRVGQLTDKWSVVQDRFVNSNQHRTIFDMEQAHPGIEFDLLPLPGNMRPANIVQQPIHSRIFVRYHNFLQRDALWKSYGIDVRKDVLDFDDANQTTLFESLFSVGKDRDGLPVVIPLDSALVPESLRRKWISKMLEFNHGVRFHFHGYKEIRMPQKWTDHLHNKQNNVIQDLFGQLRAVGDLAQIQQGDPNGDNRTIPVLGAKFPITSPYGPRPSRNQALHNGIDIGAPRGTPILAPEEGQVVQVSYDKTSGNYVMFKTDSGTWTFCHMDLVKVKKGDGDPTLSGNRLPAGTLLGTVGNTGRTSATRPDGTYDPTRGFHLHLIFSPGSSKTPVDPIPYLDRIVNDVSDSFTAVEELQPIYDYDSLPANLIETTTADQITELARSKAKETLELTEQETDALQELLQVLASEGWSYYDQDTTVTNVWQKLLSLDIRNSGLDIASGRTEMPEEFKQDGIILTSVSGSLSHLVAHIPILSHEFPTQQHLGSMEPEYALEFAILDDQSNLEGISSMGQLVQGMRSTLQSNSRKFRPVMDGWCVATDTFITRLFGTYLHNDFMTLTIDGAVVDAELKKRSIISNSYEGTIPGSPGLSTLSLSIQETNPYETQSLVSTSSGLQDKEAARAEVLKATMGLQLAAQYKDILAPLFLAQKLKVNLSDQTAADFGKFSIKTTSVFPTSVTGAKTDAFLFNGDGEQKLLIRQSAPNELEVLKALGLEADYYAPNGTPTDFIEINPNQMDSYNIGSIDYDQTSALGSVLTTATGVLGKGYYLYNGGPDGVGTYTGAPIDPLLLQNERFQVSGLDTVDYPTANVYDIAMLAEQNPALAQLPVQKFMDYYVAIAAYIQTGNRMFAEPEEGGLEASFVSNELYGLPFKQDMWKSWQIYLEEFVKVSFSSSPTTALTELHQNPSWSRPGRKNWESQVPEELRSDMTMLANTGFGTGNTNTGWLYDMNTMLWNKMITSGLAAVSKNYEASDIYHEAHEDALNRLVSRYMLGLPISVWLPDYIKSQYQFLIGNIVGTSGSAPALDFMSKYLRENASSVGNITYDFVGLNSQNPIWQSADVNEGNRNVHTGVMGQIGAMAPPLQIESLPFGIKPQEFYDSNVKAGTATLENIGLTGASDYLYGEQQIGNPLNSPFVYPTDRGYEEAKVKYIKSLLAALGDSILSDYPMLQMLGLEHLMFQDENKDFVGQSCYPDMELPAHPYYGNAKQVYPDFYMWNIYEDGGALSSDQLTAIQEQVNFVVQNCHASMTRMSQGEKFDERREQQITESSVDAQLGLNTQITPEGTEGMDSPFAPSSSARASTEQWAKELGGVGMVWDATTGTYLFNSDSGVPNVEQNLRLISNKPSEYHEQGWIPRLSNTEGPGGVGGGTQYPRRTTAGNYGLLREQFRQTQQMFGSSEGYMNAQLNQTNTPSVYEATQGTKLERPPEAAHNFDVESLKQLAKDSSKDLVSQKMSMKRAFPTFKLYFVEEDEFETRFMNFDDFYSYNAVKEIQVTQSRKMAADHAIVVLQNISGTLDGTRRNAIADLDYFSNPEQTSSAKKKFEAHSDTTSSVISGDAITANTSSEQPFGSVVLRPGLNVQLRMGFSNDPSCLHVMLSGRIVDVTWNTTGDLAEIMIQSFGAELEQVIKGTGRDGNVRTYATTHELLGAMMLEPEVVHFGRWEFGQQFQVGEAKDHKLDFTEYSREGQLGKWNITSWVTQTMMNHPYLTLGLGVGATAFSLLPMGRLFGAGAKSLAKVPGLSRLSPSLANLGATRALGEAGYVAQFTGLDDVARAGAFTTAGERILVQAAQATKGLNKTTAAEFNTLFAKKSAEAVSDFYAATNVAGEAAAVAKLEQFVQSFVFRSKWMSKPWMEIQGATFLSSVGFKPIGTLLNLSFGAPLKVGGLALGTAISVDAIINILLRPVYQATIGGANKFFARTSASLFLTPQDDNLYPPHPKDYMTLNKSSLQTTTEVAFHTAASLGFNSTDLAVSAYQFIYPDAILTKKVATDDCLYQPVSTSIWSIFHEMSLRHPGWVYGARPYGNAYRYTMFFGLPAQRYWARPASNGFITRVNQLHQFLSTDVPGDTEGNLITEYEFRALYGEERFAELQKQTESFNASAGSVPLRLLPEEDAVALSDQITVNSLRNQMTATALAEYLRAVQIRFEPFRRYHMFTSERDIVWNGIMGTENAVANAVDVTYFPSVGDRTDPENAQIRTAVFKAHSFIPESKLRIAPVRWYNCLGYGMAQRYAMGELCDRMKDMYRGDLIVLGNPRIRPWDIGILVDTFNSMVGPIEVEEVVHSFSHETGYITQIKPSAVVFANEISGWPMLEAMKLFALAVQDIHGRYSGVKADNGSSATDPGSLATAATMLANLSGEGKKYDSFIEAKYRKLFGEDGAGIENMWGSEAPLNFDSVDSFASDVYQNALGLSAGIGVAGAGLTITGGVLTGDFLRKNVSDKTFAGIGSAFVKKPMGLAFGAALIAGAGLAAIGFGAPLAMSQVDWPGTAFLMGGSVLFLQCLRNDALIVVPLTKSGNPIVAGLAYNDPALLWTSFRGRLNRQFTETLEGTGNMLDLYKRYGSEIWTRISDQDLGATAGAAAYSSLPNTPFTQIGSESTNPIMSGLTGG